MTDKLLEQIKADRKARIRGSLLHRVFENHTFDDAEEKEWLIEEYEGRIFDMEIAENKRRKADAEVIEAAQKLAVTALNTDCATQEDADTLYNKVTAFNKALKKRENTND